jgi:hypothetical protein
MGGAAVDLFVERATASQNPVDDVGRGAAGLQAWNIGLGRPMARSDHDPQPTDATAAATGYEYSAMRAFWFQNEGRAPELPTTAVANVTALPHRAGSESTLVTTIYTDRRGKIR